MSTEKPRRLGRGLEALLGKTAAPVDTLTELPATGFQQLDISKVRPNQFQPRHEFAEADLAELAASLSTSGMLQPVLVRRVVGGFELISGERRFRAALRLGWREIPAIIREADDRVMLTLALIENLQRSDLTVVEQARGFQRLQEEFELTQHQIADAVGKERSTVANLLRLLALPGPVLSLLERGELSMGHARALLSISDPKAMGALAAEIVSNQLSVREVERRIREGRRGANDRAKPGLAVGAAPLAAAKPAVVQGMENALRRRFQTDVYIRLSQGDSGSVELKFYSATDLDRLLELLVGPRELGD